MRVTLDDIEACVVCCVVQRRGDLAQATPVSRFLLTIDDDVRLVVGERGSDLVDREDLTRSKSLTGYGVRGDRQVLDPLGALVGGQRVVGPVTTDELRRLELLGL